MVCKFNKAVFQRHKRGRDKTESYTSELKATFTSKVPSLSQDALPAALGVRRQGQWNYISTSQCLLAFGFWSPPALLGTQCIISSHITNSQLTQFSAFTHDQDSLTELNKLFWTPQIPPSYTSPIIKSLKYLPKFAHLLYSLRIPTPHGSYT